MGPGQPGFIAFLMTFTTKPGGVFEGDLSSVIKSKHSQMLVILFVADHTGIIPRAEFVMPFQQLRPGNPWYWLF